MSDTNNNNKKPLSNSIVFLPGGGRNSKTKKNTIFFVGFMMGLIVPILSRQLMMIPESSTLHKQENNINLLTDEIERLSKELKMSQETTIRLMQEKQQLQEETRFLEKEKQELFACKAEVPKLRQQIITMLNTTIVRKSNFPEQEDDDNDKPTTTVVDCQQQQQQHQQQQQQQIRTTLSNTTSVITAEILGYNPSLATDPSHFFCLCKTADKCAEYCDTKITYDDIENTYNMKDSTWTTARNAMYLLTKDMIQRSTIVNEPYSKFVCFIDGDATMNNDGKQRMIQRLDEETEITKIITPNYMNSYNNASYAWMADAIFNCFSTLTIDRYLPYRTGLDAYSWWMSQNDITYRANLLESFPFKIYNDIPVYNEEHGKYPKGLKYLKPLRGKYFDGFSPGCTAFDNPPTQCTYKPPKKKGAGRGKKNKKAILMYTVEFNDTHIFKSF
jgi:hypothetical protein